MNNDIFKINYKKTLLYHAQNDGTSIDNFVINLKETHLANIIKEMVPDTIRQFSPKWIGKFAIDIFIPSLSIAVEYNGEQHYKPIERFGGEEKLIKQKERDEYVRRKCQEFNIILLEWHYEIKVTESSVYDLFSKYVDLRNHKKALTLFD